MKRNIIQVTEKQFYQLFQIKKSKIDSGTYGDVSHGVRKEDNQDVAIKYLKENIHLKSIEAEALIMEKVSHENVLSCLGLYKDITNEKYMLVTPFCGKGTLKARLKQIFQLQDKIKVNICLQLAKGIRALHLLNIMHRDIKPGNILFYSEWQLKICDLGLGQRDSSIQHISKVGTPAYMDPNVITGNYTKKCDIYSLGLVMDSIFRGEGYFENMKGQLEHEKANLFKYKEQIIGELKCPQRMKSIIIKCIQKEEVNRYDAKRLVHDLESVWEEYKPSMEFKEQIEKFKTELTSRKMPAYRMRFSTEYNSPERQEDMDNMFLSRVMFKKSSTKFWKNYNDQFLSKMICLSVENKKSFEKISYVEKVFSYFLEKKKILKEIKSFQNIKSFREYEKIILIFILSFNYTRFLVSGRDFLQGKQSCLRDISGLTFEEFTDFTKKICLDFILKELILAKENVRSLAIIMNSYGEKQKKSFSGKIHSMLGEVFEKKFTQIGLFTVEVMARQYKKLFENRQVVEEEKGEMETLLKIQDNF